MTPSLSSPPPLIHPIWVRLMHWSNALAFLVLLTSGWRIYNASPFLPLHIPADVTLGGWLGGALLWHFAAMWLLVVNGLLYLTVGLAGGRLRERLWPIRLPLLWQDLVDALRGRLNHVDLRHYNQVQRAAYVFAVLDIVVLVMSGLVLWKSVQFPLLRTLLGGYETARRVHFAGMAGGFGFLCVHVLMTLRFPQTLRAMLLGR